MSGIYEKYNSLIPPKDSKSINLLQGINGIGHQSLSNMSDIWYKLTENTQTGDIILLGGDFVMACSDCCFKQDECEKAAKQLNTTCCPLHSDGSPPCDDNCTTCKDCLCQCLPTKWKARSNDQDLLKLLIKKLQEGVIVIILDDLVFIDSLYKDNKPQHDFILANLKLASNGNFYVYTIPTSNYVHIHSKILTYFYLSAKSPYMVTNMGSFNPSYPNSLTLEIGLFVSGLLQNPLIQAIGAYMWTISNYVYNLNAKQNVGANIPLNNIAKYIKVADNYKKIITTNINFCGKIFCADTINQNNLQDRLIFSEENVEFKLGGEPLKDGKMGGGNNLFSNFFYGMDLIKGLFTNSKKHVKIGIMQGVVEQLPFCNSPVCNSDFGLSPLLFNNELMSLLKDGKGLYVMQKKPKIVNSDSTFGFMGGLWSWLEYNGANCPNLCTKTPKNLGFDGPEVIAKNPVSIRWYKSALHWKLYLSDNEIIQSTQHPTKLFYSGSNSEVTMGYELSIKNCPKLIAYYDNLYSYYWNYQSEIPVFDSFSDDVLPCGTGSLDNSQCCPIDGVKCVSSCYPGGKGPKPNYNVVNNKCVKVSEGGKYYSLEECQNTLKSKLNPVIIVIVIILLILLIIFLVSKYYKKGHGTGMTGIQLF